MSCLQVVVVVQQCIVSDDMTEEADGCAYAHAQSQQLSGLVNCIV